jgi:hypothetical protein
MLTQLSKVRDRVGLTELEVQWDGLLNNGIKAVSARFDRHCNRTLARTVNAAFEFPLRDSELLVPCYPIESVTKFETKESESGGWVEDAGVEHLVRGRCVISVTAGLGGGAAGLGRVTYTGGYVLPGSVPGPGQAALPAEIEDAAIEQVAFWFRNRDKLGLIRHWPKDGVYMVFEQLPLMRQVIDALRPHRRWCV